MVGMALDLHFRFKPEVINHAISDIFSMYQEKSISPVIASVVPLDKWKDAVNQIGKGKSAGKLVLSTSQK